jgi:cell surface protein SprA
MKRINPATDIYERSVDEVLNGSTFARFVVVGKQRKSTFDVRETSHSVNGSQCFDITPGTEKLVRNGSEVLIKNVDYEVLYETGQITLISPRARDPNAEIDVSYECNPPFQIQDKILLGTRMEYKLDGISEESMLGATLLYKSQSTTSERPELGREPFNQFLWGFNARLAGSPKWMTRVANLFPFVETEAPSKAHFDFEVAQSRYNPNTKESAYLDNFEGSENILSMPTHIFSWYKASPPRYDALGKPDESLDYRHLGKFWWHSSIKEQYSRIYGNTGNSVTNAREQVLLKLTLEPNDNLEGRSWGGVMRALSPGLFNQSRKRVLEVVVQGRNGDLNVDLGQISEDIPIPSLNNGEPDGRLQSEVDVGREVTNERDKVGLDGLSNEQERAVRWECRPTCYATPVDSADLDPGGDRYDDPEPDDTEQGPWVNGTEGNNTATGGFAFDTEDLDRSGVLDTRELYLRYTMRLDSACNARTYCEELRNGWRKYRIPLYGAGSRIGAAGGESEAQILSSVKIVRVWMGRLPARVTKAQVLLARLNIMGNAWEEGERNRDYEIDSDRFSTGDLRDSLAVRVPPVIPDSNRLRVDVINKQEDERGYQQSPNVKRERDTRTDEPLPEKSLVMRYENLHPGEAVHATRLLGSEPKDLTLYDRILMEIHPDTNWTRGSPTFRAGQNRVSLGLRLGKDQGNRDSRDYYEIRLHMDTSDLAVLDREHRTLWLRNSFEVEVDDLTGLKNDPMYRAFQGREVSRKAWHKGRGDSSLTLSVVGNPTLSRIDWMRMVIYVDSGAVESQNGEIWINDLRLEGVDKSLGTSMQTQMQLEFSDFIHVSGKLTYTNGGFTTMSQTRATPANSRSTVDYNAAASLYANKFFPDQWGVSIPINLQYQGTVGRPFTQPSSDLGLTGTGFADMMSDIVRGNLRPRDAADSARDTVERYARIYQSTKFDERFSVAYKKEHRSESFLTQALFERPDIQYSQAFSDQEDFYARSNSRNYTTKVMYSLSPFQNRSYRPMSGTGKWKYMPRFLSDMEFTPFWDKLNLTLWDMTYARTRTVNKPRNQFDVPVDNPTDFTVELSHSADLEWRPTNFFNFGYRLETNRDFDRDRECFDGSLWTEQGECGMLARGLVFSWDDEGMGEGHLGDAYGILARERNRSQTFHAGFNPNVVNWLTLGANYNAGYKQTRNYAQLDARTQDTTRPEYFEADADHDVRLNASLSLPGMLGTGGDGKGVLAELRKKLDAWRLRNFDASYTVSHKYNGEQFTYGLLEDRRLSAGSFYAYQLGLVYGGLSDFFGTLFEGEPDPYFFDWLSRPDPALNEVRFNHEVSRTVDGSTGLTVPGLDLSLSLNAKYSKRYVLYRGLQASDTSVVWPDYTVTGTFNDFAGRIGILRRYFRSMTSTTTFNYREEDKRALFSNSPDNHKTSFRLDPLVRIAATTNKDVRAELSVKLGKDIEDQYFKGSALREQAFRWYGPDTTMPIYPRIDSLRTPKEGFNVGGEASLSKDIETQKGVQFWRYYIKLQNNLRLKLSGSCNYSVQESRPPQSDPVRSQDQFTGTVKPEVSYNFTNNVDAMFFFLYKYDKLWHTAENESTHEVQLHGEFTMRF